MPLQAGEIAAGNAGNLAGKVGAAGGD